MKTEVFRMERVTYKEDEVIKLEDFNLHIFEGEILGIVPVNLHGYSSLLKLLKTNCPLYDGYIYYNEVVVNSWKNTTSTNNKITIVQNVSSLVEGLTVADNIFLLREGYRSEYVRTEVLRKQLTPFLEEINIEIQANTCVEKLSVFERIIVELLKGIVAKHRLIVLDDVESLITGQELEHLHRIIRYYTQKGYTFIYICLHAEDIVLLCNRVFLFRNGRIEKEILSRDSRVDTLCGITLDYDSMVRGYMESKVDFQKNRNSMFEMFYEFSSCEATLNIKGDASECIVIHCQNTEMHYELKNAILNECLWEKEFLKIEGINVNRSKSSRQVAIIQERATQTMIFPKMTYMDNLCISLGNRIKGIWLKKNIRKSVKIEYSEFLGTEVFDKQVESLSEREKYSLIYARVLLQKPKMVFCIQPFQGSDMDHRMHIWTLLERLLKNGIAVVVLAVNLSDTLSIADRLIQIDECGEQSEYTKEEFRDIPRRAPWKYLYENKNKIRKEENYEEIRN